MSVFRMIKFFVNGIGISDRIMTAFVIKIEKPGEEVFSDYYKGSKLQRTSKAVGRSTRI